MQRRSAKSFVDDLVLSRGVVLSRAAASLRSIETKPFDWKICPLWTDTSPASRAGHCHYMVVYATIASHTSQQLLLHGVCREAYIFALFLSVSLEVCQSEGRAAFSLAEDLLTR